MDLVLCHTTADFDTLGAAVGVTRLLPGSRIVLSGGAHPTVQTFLALHRDEYPLIERRAVDLDQVRSLTIVDAQNRDRFAPVADWIDWAEQQAIPITLYDHHTQATGDIRADHRVVEPVGAATTLVVEQLQSKNVSLRGAEATVMALGIHVDTGSLSFEQATARDALALAWLMAQGASQRAIAEFVEPGLSPTLQALLTEAMESLTVETQRGFRLASVLLSLENHVPGLSNLTERLMSLSDSDCFLLGAHYPLKSGSLSAGEDKLVLIGRVRGRAASSANGHGINFNEIFQPLGGGGHPTAAAVTLTTPNPQAVMGQAMAQVRSQVPHPPTARELMSSPVRTIRPGTTIQEAQRILLRYGHSGLSVVNAQDELVGIISRRDIDLALHHGFSHAPVKGYMTIEPKTIHPDTPLPQIEQLMVTYDIGRLPVLDGENLIGIVTRTDVLRQLHQDQQGIYADEDEEVPHRPPLPTRLPPPDMLTRRLQQALKPGLWDVLQQMAEAAQAQGWHLYLVGGAVRDLLRIPTSQTVELKDLDLVVDGYYQSAQVGAGVALAEAIKASYPAVELQVYGRFQTAALVWHKDSPNDLAGLMVDVATARTEFYPYPAANPEVEASSIRQDLYRRDFTINAMAIRLTRPGTGTLLDFFGGLIDLCEGRVRVLHANSFIEDPTRIYRAVRFAVRLGFALDSQTESYIQHALESGIYTQMQRQVAQVPALQARLRNELEYILEADYWQPALHWLERLGALQCLHPDLVMDAPLWHQLRRLTRWIEHFDLALQMRPWELRLQVLLAAVPPPDRGTVAEHLQLPLASQQRLGTLAAQEQAWLQALSTDLPPSQVVQQLREADLATLLLVSARHPRPLGQLVWRYLTQWSKVKPPLNGNHLKALGYRPGPRFREILDTLLNATLDGQIQTPAEAEAFLAAHYPPD
ncbi:MAG: CBS domain-containing protein [Cyanobacteria bacterium Co-bin13]|nr:CBS domain-containing protein [Cyanobacteria bacterium Co-bin13]